MMFKTLFTSVLLTGAFISNAQKLEIGLNGGIAPYMQLKAKDYCPPVGKSYHRPGYFASVRGAVSYRHWQTGVAVDNYRTSRTGDPARKYGTQYNSVAVGVFGNRIYRTCLGNLYTGVNAGYVFTKYKAVVDPAVVYESLILLDMNYRGFYVGGQVGCTKQVYKKLSANIELAGRYSNNLNSGINKKLIFPATIGVRYEL